MENLKKLYDLLKDNYKPLSEDLSYDELPDVNIEINTEFPEVYKHLANQHSVCCEQKIIYWDENSQYFIISCLYNSHPTLRYKTKEEVLALFKGYTKYFEGYCKYDDKKDAIDKAYQDSRYLISFENVDKFKYQFNLNVTDTIKYID